MGYKRRALILPAGSKVTYPINSFSYDLLNIDHSWAITGYKEAVKASLNFVGNDKKTLLWSAKSTDNIPEDSKTLLVNEGWQRETLSNFSLTGQSGQLELSVELADHSLKHHAKNDIDGSAVLILGEALLYKKETASYNSLKPNLVFLSIDSLTPYALPGGKRAEHYIAPNFERLMKDGATSNVCISSGGMTYLTLPSILTSRYPQRNGVIAYCDQLLPNIPSIGSILDSAGYEVIQFADSYILRTPWIPSTTGFAISRYRPNKDEPENDLLSYLKTDNERPFFAYFHQDTRYGHIDLGEWDGKEDIRQRQYRRLVSHADALLGQVRAFVEKQRLHRPTILIVTADHGEDIVGTVKWSHCHLYEGCLRIPFIIDYPEVVASGHRFDRQSRAIDISPTLLSLMGVKIPPEFDGDDLSPLFKGNSMEGKVPAAFSTYSMFNGNYVFGIREPPWKYIYNPSNKPTRWYPYHGFVYEKEELYDIEQDPDEKVNLADKHPEECKRLRQKFKGPGLSGKPNGKTNKSAFTQLLRDGYLERRSSKTTKE